MTRGHMLRPILAPPLLALLLWALPATAQDKRGEIAGTVTDSSRAPVADADVFLRGANRRARTDSAGNYRFSGLAPKTYSLIARKLGYQFVEADVMVRAGATVRQDFTVGKRVWLPEVEVTARAECPLGETILGFFCRQVRGGGTFLDYPEIDFRGVTYTAELFGHIRGFRVATRRSSRGAMEPVPVHIGARCVRYIVDGRVRDDWNAVPVAAKDITAIEAFVRPDTIPPEVKREMLFGGAQSRSCDAVLLWTRFADR